MQGEEKEFLIGHPLPPRDAYSYSPIFNFISSPHKYIFIFLLVIYNIIRPSLVGNLVIVNFFSIKKWEALEGGLPKVRDEGKKKKGYIGKFPLFGSKKKRMKIQ